MSHIAASKITPRSYHGNAYVTQSIYVDPFFQIEATTVVWFTVELLLRFIACPTKRSFIRDVVNLFDIVAVLPFYGFLILQLSAPQERYCESIRKSGVYIILRLLRVLRIFKLAKHSRGLRVLGRTIRTSLHELWVFTFFLLVGTVIYSAFVYHAESGEPRAQITSIPAGFWWAIITLTTVGYGDVTPIGIWGRLVGTLCVITGVLTVALPVPIIVANFNAIYRHEIRQGKIGREGREYMEGRGHVDAQGRR